MYHVLSGSPQAQTLAQQAPELVTLSGGHKTESPRLVSPVPICGIPGELGRGTVSSKLSLENVLVELHTNHRSLEVKKGLAIPPQALLLGVL